MTSYANDEELELELELEYAITATNDVVRVGDCVLFPSIHAGNHPSYLGRIEKIKSNIKLRHTKVSLRRYYRPEESIQGRRNFHGSKELFLSDRYYVVSADAIEGKCRVHTLKKYMRLENVGDEDYFFRWEYNTVTSEFYPDKVPVYCYCDLPKNPDEFMLRCQECKERFHPVCLKMTTAAAKSLQNFLCSRCVDGSVED